MCIRLVELYLTVDFRWLNLALSPQVLHSVRQVRYVLDVCHVRWVRIKWDTCELNAKTASLGTEQSTTIDVYQQNYRWYTAGCMRPPSAACCWPATVNIIATPIEWKCRTTEWCRIHGCNRLSESTRISFSFRLTISIITVCFKRWFTLGLRVPTRVS